MSKIYQRCCRCSRIAATCPHRHVNLPDDGTTCPFGIKRPENVAPLPTIVPEARIKPQVADRLIDAEPPVSRVSLPTGLDRARELFDRLKGLQGKGLPFAKEWLRTVLETGRMSAVDVYGIAELEVDENGKRRFSKRTLDTAKKELGIRSIRYGFGENGIVFWELPQYRFCNQ